MLGNPMHAKLSSSHWPVFDVREVPCGGPGAVEPVAAGPEVAGEETEDMAPATETGWAGVLAVLTDTPALGVHMPPLPPWKTARATDIWLLEPWRAEIVVVTGAEIGAEVTAEAGLIIKAVVDVVVLALLSELAAEKEDTGMLTNVPAWPLATDNGSWMSRGWPVVIMLPPGAVFNNNVPVGFWELKAVGRGETAFEVEVMSWRTGACITIAVEVGTGTGTGAGAGACVGTGAGTGRAEAEGATTLGSFEDRILKIVSFFDFSKQICFSNGINRLEKRHRW